MGCGPRRIFQVIRAAFTQGNGSLQSAGGDYYLRQHATATRVPTQPVDYNRPLRQILAFSSNPVIVCDMSKAKKLLHTRYRVNDLQRTVDFYKNVLGLEETRRHKSPRGSELVFMKAPDSEELIELCHFPGSGPVQVQPDLTHLAFEVESLEEFGKHLAAKGLKYSDGPHLKPDGGGIAFVDAPEGYEIELIQMAKSGQGY